MRTFVELLRDMRHAKGWTHKQLCQASGIDQALISKFENAVRLPSEQNMIDLSRSLSDGDNLLRKAWLVEKIHHLLQYEIEPKEILMAAETRVDYLSSSSVHKVMDLPEQVEKELLEVDALYQKWIENPVLNQVQKQKMEEYFSVKYTYNSNKIEGNTLSLHETHLVINKGLTIGGKGVVEHLEAINHAEATEWIRTLAETDAHIDRRTLLDIHRLVLKTIDTPHAGIYRKVPVRISGSEHIPPEPYLIEKMMEDYFLFYQKYKRHLHPVILAAEMHERLVSIHPFIDGNGRTSRLLMNLILLQHGYPIAILKGDDASRLAYYESLENVQGHNEPIHFHLLIIECVKRSLKEHLEMI